MELIPIHDQFGVEITGIDLRTVTVNRGYTELREAFETHSLLLFRDQHLSDDAQMNFARLWGPLEDREERPEPKISHMSNAREDGSVANAHDMQTLNLKANQLWHTDSTFLPVPALANVLQARVVTSSGGETEFVSTRAGLKRLPAELRTRLDGMVFHHRFAHSRAKIDPDLAKQDKITKWRDQSWRALWRNPENGEDALYVASHVFAVEGMSESDGQTFIDDLIVRMTPDEAIYTHVWQPGDVIIWDERATLHRGRAWPYEQPRTLASICVTAQECDGLDAVRPSSFSIA